MAMQPFLQIRDNFILLKVATNDISWAGTCSKADRVAHNVSTTWKIGNKIHKLKSTADAWVSYGDCGINEYSFEWITNMPSQYYAEVAEDLQEYITKSLHCEVGPQDLQRYLDEDEDLLETLNQAK